MELEEERIEKLIQPPTVEGWKELLRLIVAGRVSKSLLENDPLLYIRNLLATSKSSRSTAECFKTALNEIVITWKPGQGGQPAWQAATFLRLIAAFRPAAGWSLLVGFLPEAAPYQVVRSLGYNDVDVSGGDLHQLALDALAAYVPGPPDLPVGKPGGGEELRANAGYRAYVTLLKSHLGAGLVTRESLPLQRYRRYALRRLLQLGVIHPATEEMKYVIETGPECLIDVVDYLFAPGRQAELVSDLAVVYRYCLEAGQRATAILAPALKAHGYSLVPSEIELKVIATDERIPLLPRGESREEYQKVVESISRQNDLKSITSLRAFLLEAVEDISIMTHLSKDEISRRVNMVPRTQMHGSYNTSTIAVIYDDEVLAAA